LKLFLRHNDIYKHDILSCVASWSAKAYICKWVCLWTGLFCLSYAFYYRGKIIELIEANKVVVLSGETGCGKTTQVITMQLDTWRVFTWASYPKISNCTVSVLNTHTHTHKKKQIKESGYLTQELSLDIYYSSCFAGDPLYPIACFFVPPS